MILTSNLGSDVILEGSTRRVHSDEARNLVKQSLKQSFRPSSSNRLDEIVLSSETKTDLVQIVDLLIADHGALAAPAVQGQRDRRGKGVIVDSAATRSMARDRSTVYPEHVETLLARKSLAATFTGELVDVDKNENGLFVR